IVTAGALTRPCGAPREKDHWRTTGAGSSGLSGRPSSPRAARPPLPRNTTGAVWAPGSTRRLPVLGADQQTARQGADNTSAEPDPSKEYQSMHELTAQST